jgi:hypothetical protein
MKKTMIIAICIFTLGIVTSLFRHKIVAGQGPQVIAEDKVLVTVSNDSEYAVRVYLNQDAANTTLVNPGRTFSHQIRGGDMINIYMPKNNTTFHVTLNKAGRTELLGKEMRMSVEDLGNIASERTASWTAFQAEKGSTQYFDVEEESVSPWGSGAISY